MHIRVERLIKMSSDIAFYLTNSFIINMNIKFNMISNICQINSRHLPFVIACKKNVDSIRQIAVVMN